MNWQSRLLRTLVARLHPVELRLPVMRHLRLKSAASRHTGPGFGTLVIGHSQRDWPGGR